MTIIRLAITMTICTMIRQILNFLTTSKLKNKNKKIANFDFLHFHVFFLYSLLRRKKAKKVIQYEFTIRTTQTSGLLLWNSKIRHSLRDYVAISIVDGFIEFCHYFGKEQQTLLLKSEVKNVFSFI